MKRTSSLVLSLITLAGCLLHGGTTRAADPSSAVVAADNAALVVLIYDQSCKTACSRVRPIMQELLEKYSDKLRFVELNADDPNSEKTAKLLKIVGFYEEHEDWYPAVGIFTPLRHKLIKEIDGVKSKEIYVAAIEQALKNTSGK